MNSLFSLKMISVLSDLTGRNVLAGLVNHQSVGLANHQSVCSSVWPMFNTLRPRQNGRHFADDVFKCIYLNENMWISLKISLKFVHKGLINNIPSLVQIMAWCRPGGKPLSEPMMVSLLTHICVTRPQWVNIDCTAQQAVFYVPYSYSF